MLRKIGKPALYYLLYAFVSAWLFLFVVFLCTGPKKSKTAQTVDSSKKNAKTAAVDSVAIFKEKLEREIKGIRAKAVLSTAQQASSKDYVQLEYDNLKTTSIQLEQAKLFNKQLKDTGLIRLISLLEPLAINRRVQVFPNIRAKVAESLGKALWENNVKVRVEGVANTSITFIGGIFASNKNKKLFVNKIHCKLMRCRFQEASFFWTEYDNDGTAWNLKAKLDNEPIEGPESTCSED